MRLNRLDLIRYGRFQDFTLDFGVAPVGAPDVTVVYGANEAGKSTAFGAWLDLLFGVPAATPYAFRFDRRDLLIGAVLDTPDGIQTPRRSTAGTGSLTDAAGHVLADHRMAGWLRGLDRESYRNRFSLNDAVLREGGKEIAKARGDLGQLLHAGTSGLSGLSDALAKVEEEVEAFHKKNGRATVANQGRKRLRELDQELRALRLDPRGFDRLLTARDTAEAVYLVERDALAEARRALKLREAAEARGEIARRIKELRARLAACPAGPDLAPGAVARVAGAVEKRAAAAEKAAKAEAAARAALGELETLDDDPEGQRAAALFEALETAVLDEGELLLPRAQTAQFDLAKRREELGEIRRGMEAIAARLAGPDADPGPMIPPRPRIAAIRSAAEAARTARATLNGESQARARAELDLGDPVAAPAGLAELEDASLAWHRLPDTLGDASRDARTAEDALAEAVVGLPPDWRETAAAGLPETGEIEQVAEAARRAAGLRDAASAARDEAEGLWRLARDARDVLGARPDIVPDAAIAQTRARRDAGWAAHRADLTALSAETFARAMRDDDAARDRHAATAEDRTRLSLRSEEVDRARALLDQKSQGLEAARAEVGIAEAAVAGMAARLGLSGGAPVEALRQRRDRLEAAARAARAAEAARASAEALRSTADRRLGDLRDALAAVGLQGPDDRLPAIAARAIEELRRQAAAADAWREARKSIDRMRGSEALATRALADLERGLAAELDGLWCAGFDAARVLEALPALEELASLDADRARLAGRIASMEAAVTAFEALAKGLRELLGLPGTTGPTDLLARARQRVSAAEEARRRLIAAREALARAERDGRDAAVEQAAAEREIAQALKCQSASEAADPVAAVSLLADRDALRGELAAAEAARQAAGGAFDPGALAAEEADGDPSRAETLAEAVQAAELRRDAALEARVGARTALETALAGEGGAAADQERAALIESLRQDGREALARRFGLLAARGALRRFRQSQRGAMLAATETAFAHLTRGEWPRLETRTQGANELLVGIRNDEPVAVDAMSTGTQGQLYLALRVAGHAAFVAEHGPLPFVTDDIHETFDDARAQAALELTAAMGERGQAILFTHHRHLVELARAAIPSVRLLELR